MLSWKFFWRDNIVRICLTGVFVFIWALFGAQLSAFLPADYQTLGKLSYILIGMGTDVIVDFILKRFKKFEVKI